MIKAMKMLFVYTETPLHVGSGASISMIDLPIQREKHTQYPIVQASSLKGAVRSEATRAKKDGKKLEIVFGPERDAHRHGGALSLTDARILLFPVRSLSGVFAWITSTQVLERFRRDLAISGSSVDWSVPSSPQKAIGTTKSDVVVDGRVVLEEYTFEFEANNDVDKIATWIAQNAIPNSQDYKFWQDKVQKSLLILPEDSFRDFTLFGTEVVARVRLDYSTKTVSGPAGEGPWYEENLPSDTLLYSIAMATDPLVEEDQRPPDLKSAGDIITFLDTLGIERISLGGDETVGRGIVRIRI